MIIKFSNDEYEAHVAAKQHDLKVEREAKRREASELWTPPAAPGSVYDQLAEGIPEIDWVVEGLIPAGVAHVAAQRKTGKTTLALNLARSLLTSEPFLQKFPVRMKADEQVGFVNMELPRAQMLTWIREMGLTDDAQKRLTVYHAMDDGFATLDWNNDLAVEWTVKWLTEHGVTVLVADPLAKLYNPARWGSRDPNASFTAWWKVLEDIFREAKLRAVLLTNHTGFSEEAGDRARGASAMMDNPTVNMAFRHNGDYQDLLPLDRKRYLKAMGRDVLVDEFELDYLPLTREFYATGGGRRVDAEMVKLARKLWSSVLSADRKGEKPNKRELLDELGWGSGKGSGADKYNRAYRHAVKEQWVKTEPGPKNSKLHMVGPCRPDDAFAGLKVQVENE